jgi:hypothetical protein
MNKTNYIESGRITIMKFKTTKKNMNANYDQIASVGYCNAQYLLGYENPMAYSTRAEGWACDYYDVNGILISTGYAPLSSKHTKPDYNIVRKYDDLARENYYSSGSYEERKAKADELLKEFAEEITR